METTSRSSYESASDMLESGLRLSDSILWRDLRRYFQQMGIRSWSQGRVPHYITTNPFVARYSCSRCLPRLGPATISRSWSTRRAVHVIELGSGSGRFAFHFLRSILPSLPPTPAFRGIRLRYVMTDFSDSHLEFWLKHPRLAPFVESGVLDFALFDPTQEDSLTLHHARETFGPGQVANPVAVPWRITFSTARPTTAPPSIVGRFTNASPP